jgi:CRP-like cAMP-binding protein
MGFRPRFKAVACSPVRPEADELRGIPLFADLPPQAFERVASWLEERHVEAGERLTPEGASGYTFHVMLEGSASVTCDGTAIAELGPGDFFGEARSSARQGGGTRPSSSPRRGAWP